VAEKVLDFRPKYRREDLDRAAADAGDRLGPVFEANQWTWEGRVPTAAEIALTVRRLLEAAAESEHDGETGTGRIMVRRYQENDLRIFLVLGGVTPDET
jgi:hypothetical protein